MKLLQYHPANKQVYLRKEKETVYRKAVEKNYKVGASEQEYQYDVAHGTVLKKKKLCIVAKHLKRIILWLLYHLQLTSFTLVGYTVVLVAAQVKFIPRRVNTDGTTTPTGRVEIYDSTTATYKRLCDSYFYRDEAGTVCKEAGYDGGEYYWRSYISAGASTTAFYPYYYNCYASHSTVSACLKYSYGPCGGNRDACVYCYKDQTGMILYTGYQYGYYGFSPSGSLYGLVAIRSGTYYNYVLDTDWDDNDAKVICHEAGYKYGIAMRGSRMGYSTTYLGSWLNNIACTGTETKLSECTSTKVTSPSYAYNMASAYCFDTEQTAGFTAVRTLSLHGQFNQAYGEVHLMYKGLWGRICDYSDTFSEAAANVTCKMMKYKGGWHRSNGIVSWTGYLYPFLLSNIKCTGQETNLWDCPSDGILTAPQNCRYYYDTPGVLCYNSTESEEYSTVSLKNINYAVYGRNTLFLHWRGITGLIVDTQWTRADANVTCKMMGYETGWPLKGYERQGLHGYPRYVPILQNVICEGHESHLSECAHPEYGQVNMNYVNFVTVWCSNDTDPGLELRLYGSESTPSSGAVQIKFHGLWGNICTSNNWGVTEATVVCRQLNYTYGVQNPDFDGSRNIGSPFWMYNIKCNGNESAIWDCSFPGWGGHHSCSMGYNEAGVLCYNQELSYELIGGPTRFGGTLVFTIDDIKGTAYDYRFYGEEANKVCSAWGYTSYNIYRLNSYYGPGPGKVLVRYIDCSSIHKDIFDCRSDGWGQAVSSYTHNDDIGVFCADFRLTANGLRTVSADYGSFTTYGHPMYYRTYDSYLRITVPYGNRVKLTFDYFSLESVVNVDNCTIGEDDTLILYDGPDNTAPEIARYCGRAAIPPSHNSTGQQMYLEFLNDKDSDQYNFGFAAAFERECLGRTIWTNTTLSLGPSSHTLKYMADITDEVLCKIQCDRLFPDCRHVIYDTNNSHCYFDMFRYYNQRAIDLTGHNSTLLKWSRTCQYAECDFEWIASQMPTTGYSVISEHTADSFDECLMYCRQLGNCTGVQYDSTTCATISGDNYLYRDGTTYRLGCYEFTTVADTTTVEPTTLPDTTTFEPTTLPDTTTIEMTTPEIMSTVRPIVCQPIPSWFNVESNVTSPQLGEQIDYFCKAGFEFEKAKKDDVIPTLQYASCSAIDGTWSPIFHSCIEIIDEEAEKAYWAPVEAEGAEFFGLSAIIFLGLEVLLLMVMDVTTVYRGFKFCGNTLKGRFSDSSVKQKTAWDYESMDNTWDQQNTDHFQDSDDLIDGFI